MIGKFIDFPPALFHRLGGQLGDQFIAFKQALASPPPISIRLNPRKVTEKFNSEEIVPWCTSGRYLESRPRFTDDPLFHAGCYYVQESSSMYLGYMLSKLVDLSRNIRVLDLCAAPGGKSTLLQSLITEDSILVANEVIGSRNKVLHQNLIRWGGDNYIISQSDPKAFQKLPGFFDVIVVDAPCSGEGLMRREPSAMQEWSEANVLLCAARQKRILADILPALAPDGILIYSTCTFSPMENEANMDWLRTESALIPMPVSSTPEWGIQETNEPHKSYRFYPHHLRGEGFFIAAFKNNGVPPFKQKRSKKLSPGKYRTEAATAEDRFWLDKADRYLFVTREQHRLAFPRSIYEDYLILSKSIRITHSGLNLGKVYHGQLKPSPELALNQFISKDLPCIDLDQESALDYLAHIHLTHFKKPTPGRYLVTYNGFGLGWMNVLGTGQIRNNYPSAWRILQRFGKS